MLLAVPVTLAPPAAERLGMNQDGAYLKTKARGSDKGRRLGSGEGKDEEFGSADRAVNTGHADDTEPCFELGLGDRLQLRDPDGPLRRVKGNCSPSQHLNLSDIAVL